MDCGRRGAAGGRGGHMEDGARSEKGKMQLRRRLLTVLRMRALTWREGETPPVSVSKKLACGDLFRQDTFPLRLRRGRGNVQGNLAAQGFRIHRTCRWIRISFGGDGGKRVPCGHLREAQSDPEESTETSGGRGQRPPRRLRLRTCGPSEPPERVFDSLAGGGDPSRFFGCLLGGAVLH